MLKYNWLVSNINYMAWRWAVEQEVMERLKNYNQIDCEIVLQQILDWRRYEIPEDIQKAVEWVYLCYILEVYLNNK